MSHGRAAGNPRRHRCRVHRTPNPRLLRRVAVYLKMPQQMIGIATVTAPLVLYSDWFSRFASFDAMRYRIRTLLILLGVSPPLLAVGWTKYTAWREEQHREANRMELEKVQAAPNAAWLGASPPFTPEHEATIIRLEQRSMELQGIKR